MKQFFQAALACAAFLFAQTVNACVVSDDAGNRVALFQPAKRIIVLSPDLVEDLFAIGAGAKIVGVIKGSDYPQAARNIQQVGSYAGIDLEKIVELKPDLIISWKYAFPKQIAALRRLGFQVYVSAPRQLDDVPDLLRKLGCLTGAIEQANAKAQIFTQQINELRERYHTRQQLDVFYLVDANALITINRYSWINQVIELCGGNNIFAGTRVISPEVSRESVVIKNPDVIFYNGDQSAWKMSWQDWPQIKAVKSGRLYTINPDLIARPGPRLVQGAAIICQKLDDARTG